MRLFLRGNLTLLVHPSLFAPPYPPLDPLHAGTASGTTATTSRSRSSSPSLLLTRTSPSVPSSIRQLHQVTSTPTSIRLQSRPGSRMGRRTGRRRSRSGSLLSGLRLLPFILHISSFGGRDIDQLLFPRTGTLPRMTASWWPRWPMGRPNCFPGLDRRGGESRTSSLRFRELHKFTTVYLLSHPQSTIHGS